MSEKTVVCLKWGKNLYDVEWVNRLYRSVARHITPPFNFVCFTDEAEGLEPAIDARDIHSLTIQPELSGIWWKLAVLHPVANLKGSCLFLDLDVVITDSLDDFFTYPGRFCMIHNWIERRKQIFRPRPLIGNSSTFRFTAGQEFHVVDQFLADPARAKNHSIYVTEQAFMTQAVGLEHIKWWPEKWVRSFKRHCLPIYPLNKWTVPKIPTDCRILAFHGNPKINEVIAGVNCGGRKHCLPMPELEKYWQ